MKLLILGDLHLVSPDDPDHERCQRRAHFTQGRRVLPALRDAIRRESPDYLLSLGDLVDWYSDENRDFALEFLHSLNLSWSMTPGNHDAAPFDKGGKGLQGWEEAGVQTGNRKLELDHLQAFLVNSHDSNVPEGTAAWLREELDPDATNIFFTHVPPDTPETRAAILEREPQRDLSKYVQSKAPGLFEAALADRVDQVWSGHLHFHATARKGRTHFQILPLSIHAWSKTYPEQGALHFLDTKTMTHSVRTYPPKDP